LKSKLKFWLFVLLLSFIFKPLWTIETDKLDFQDDLSYWLHGATVALDFDLDYTNDYQSSNSIFDSKTNAPSHPPGSGYATSPFIFIFEKIDKLAGNKVERINPTGTFSYLGYFFGTLFYCFMGFFLLSRIVDLKNLNYYPLLYFIVLFSSLIHFVSTRFLMSHSFEFFLCCALLYIFETKNSLLKKEYFIFVILIYFLLAITRPSTFIYTLALLAYYKSKFSTKLQTSEIILNIFSLSFFIGIYITLSRVIYNENTILLNLSSNATTSEFTSSFNFEFYLNGLTKLPNLLFSPSMGLIFIMPTIFYSLYFVCRNLFVKRNVSFHNIFLFLYFLGAFSVLFIWQGREVAYGQRLLIGLLPLTFVILSKLEIRKMAILKFHFFILYFHYLFFYSPNLSLIPGKTLWGSIVQFAPTNYSLNLISNFYQIENISYILLKNIYAVNIFNVVSFETFFSLPLFSKLLNTIGQTEKLTNLIQDYSSVDVTYLILLNLGIFLFSYKFTKLAFKS
jgi:hypothetical protein